MMTEGPVLDDGEADLDLEDLYMPFHRIPRSPATDLDPSLVPSGDASAHEATASLPFATVL